MSWLKTNKSVNRVAYSITVLGLIAVVLWFGASFNTIEASGETSSGNLGGTTIPGTGTGAIPDDAAPGCGAPTGAPLNITFNSTVTGTLTDVEVDMTGTHSWVGDISASLIAPDGTTHPLYGFTGSTTATGCGADDDLAGLYSFNDAAAGNWWTEAGTATPMAPGSYRTSTNGGVVGGGAVTSMNPVFAAVNPTGTWTLRVTDAGNGDTGSITAANLTLTTSAPPASQPPQVDMDGDGKSDFTVIRDEAPVLRDGESSPLLKAKSYRERLEIQSKTPQTENVGLPNQGTNLVWYINNSSNGLPTVAGFGEPATDFATPDDFDGDGKDDIAVWRGVAATGPNGGFFFILNSSDMTIDQIDFGVQGDDPTIVGDYDGDGSADPAVYRCGVTDGQCFYYYKGSAGMGEITFVPWGFGSIFSVFPNAGDFDGDGKYDFCVQTDNPDAPGQGLFNLYRSSDNGIEYINWGLNSDLIAPGDYDGDGKSDFAVGRNQGGNRFWYVLTRNNTFFGAQWGLSADFMTPGDYDGDGKTDISVFRPDANPDNNIWYFIKSSDQTSSGFEWGNQGDYPVENFRVH